MLQKKDLVDQSGLLPEWTKSESANITMSLTLPEKPPARILGTPADVPCPVQAEGYR